MGYHSVLGLEKAVLLVFYALLWCFWGGIFF